jgi:fido (protein-threonine AMPylation protein)
MAVAWNDDPPGSEPQIAANVAAILADIASTAHARIKPAHARIKPSVAMAQAWHRDVYRGIPLPVPYYAGEIRDSDPEFPELERYEVAVGEFAGAPSSLVPRELARFQSAAEKATEALDAAVPVGSQPADNHGLLSVLTLCASLHGEWVRIHPFANGNGRTARLWANWAALRYGLPPFVVIKPRPAGIAYALAAYASMQRDHQVMTGVFLEMLQAHAQEDPSRPVP